MFEPNPTEEQAMPATPEHSLHDIDATADRVLDALDYIDTTAPMRSAGACLAALRVIFSTVPDHILAERIAAAQLARLPITTADDSRPATDEEVWSDNRW